MNIKRIKSVKDNTKNPKVYDTVGIGDISKGVTPGMCGIVPEGWSYIDFDYSGDKTKKDNIVKFKKLVFEYIKENYPINHIMETDKGYHLWFEQEVKIANTGQLHFTGCTFDIRKEGGLFFIQKETPSSMVRYFTKTSNNNGKQNRDLNGFLKKSMPKNKAREGFITQINSMFESDEYKKEGWLNSFLHTHLNPFLGTMVKNTNAKIKLAGKWLKFWGLTIPHDDLTQAMRKEEEIKEHKPSHAEVASGLLKESFSIGSQLYIFDNELITVETHLARQKHDIEATKAFIGEWKNQINNRKRRLNSNKLIPGYSFVSGNNLMFYYIDNTYQMTLVPFDIKLHCIISHVKFDISKKVTRNEWETQWDKITQSMDKETLESFKLLLVDLITPYKFKYTFSVIGPNGAGKTTLFLTWMSDLLPVAIKTKHDMSSRFVDHSGVAVTITDDVRRTRHDKETDKQRNGSSKMRIEKKGQDVETITLFATDLSLSNNPNWLEPEYTQLVREKFIIMTKKLDLIEGTTMETLFRGLFQFLLKKGIKGFIIERLDCQAINILMKENVDLIRVLTQANSMAPFNDIFTPDSNNWKARKLFEFLLEQKEEGTRKKWPQLCKQIDEYNSQVEEVLEIFG